MKYIYRVEPIKVGAIGFLNDSGKQAKQLGANGSDGWELVCVSEGKKYLKYVYCKEVSDEEYEAELAKAKPVKAVKPKKELTPEQKKLLNLILMIATGLLALAALVMSCVTIFYLFPLYGELVNDLWMLEYGTKAPVGSAPIGYWLALILSVLGIVVSGLAFWKKKKWLSIVAVVMIILALVFALISMNGAQNAVEWVREELHVAHATISP